MAGLFKTPKVQTTQPVDPADTANRAANARLRRLSEGGSVSTILSDAMGGAKPAAQRATLTGLGG